MTRISMFTLLGSLAIGAISPGVNAEQSDAAAGAMLVEPAELSRRLAEFVILDARSARAYAAGHIPGAIHVSADNWKTNFRSGKDAADWSKRIGGLGIDGRRPVVVYDDIAGKDAARVWWMLRYWGVSDARLLNGFWKGWSTAKLPVEREMVAPAAVAFVARPAAERYASKSKLINLLSKDSAAAQIVDARSTGEHEGTESMNNLRCGHIPGAKNLDWSMVVDANGTQRFRSRQEILKLLKERGIAVNRPTVAHCQSGGRSSVMAFAIELVGGEPVANYHEGWSEWSKDPVLPIIEPKSAKAGAE